MKKLVITLCALVITSIASISYAAELKIGIIDMNQILQKSPLMISINNELIKRFQPRQDELIAAQKQLQDDTNRLNINGATLSPDDRAKLQNKILAEQANVQVLNANLQKDLAIAKDEAGQKFTRKLGEVITKIAKAGNYDLIQQNSGFAFVNTKLDITQDVINEVR